MSSGQASGHGVVMRQQQQSGPPYRPAIWTLGGQATVGVDVPITAVLLALFICGAATHMTIFQLNKRRGHKFLFSGMMFGFCMARITTCILRIASTCLPQNIRLAIAAQIMVAAGVLLVFIINIVFAQRLIRAQHPNWGWHRAFSLFLKAIYVLVVCTLAIVITATVQTFYTLDTNIRRIDRDLQLYGATYLMCVSFLPIPMVLLGLILPRKQKVDKFGQGRFRTKIIILLISSFLVCFGAAYRCGTSYRSPVPRTQPLPSYFHKGAFYIVNFGVEIIVVYLYAILRIDLRFHIPDGARGHGSYSAGAATMGAKKEPETNSSGMLSRIYTEEETFDDLPDPETVLDDEEKAADTKRSGSMS